MGTAGRTFVASGLGAFIESPMHARGAGGLFCIYHSDYDNDTMYAMDLAFTTISSQVWSGANPVLYIGGDDSVIYAGALRSDTSYGLHQLSTSPMWTIDKFIELPYSAYIWYGGCGGDSSVCWQHHEYTYYGSNYLRIIAYEPDTLSVLSVPYNKVIPGSETIRGVGGSKWTVRRGGDDPMPHVNYDVLWQDDVPAGLSINQLTWSWPHTTDVGGDWTIELVADDEYVWEGGTGGLFMLGETLIGASLAPGNGPHGIGGKTIF